VKGLILSGGAGTRLRPITHTSAKQLVPIANKPILFYGIEDMAAAGIEEIGIIIAPATGDEIREHVGDGSQFGVAVTWIVQDEPLGLAHCVLIARDFLGDDDFVLYVGDNMLQQGLADFVGGVEKGRRADPQRGVDRVPPAPLLLPPLGDTIASVGVEGGAPGGGTGHQADPLRIRFDPERNEVVDVRTVFWNGAPADDPDQPDPLPDPVDDVRYHQP